MSVQKQDNQHEHTFSSYVVLKTCLGRWTIGRSGERGSGISVLPARHDDDDDDEEFCSIVAISRKHPNLKKKMENGENIKEKSFGHDFKDKIFLSILTAHGVTNTKFTNLFWNLILAQDTVYLCWISMHSICTKFLRRS